MLVQLLKSVARRVTGVLWRDASEAHALRRTLDKTRARLDRIEVRLRDTEVRAVRADRISMRLEFERTLNTEHQDILAKLPMLFDESSIESHVRHAIANTPLLTAPSHHMVVDQVLPPEIYNLLLQAIPPEVFFDYRDPIKQNLFLPLSSGPKLTVRAWGFMDEIISGKIIRRAIMDRFREPLEAHFDTIFGTAYRQQANELPFLGRGGRIMLRRPGYHLRPHRDPKRSMLTCLLYLARPGDSHGYGTQLFGITGDTESRYKQTYYPEGDNLTCHLEKTVPFRANTMLVILNSHGAHGATIPLDAPGNVERYAYQFYVAPQNAALSTLIKTLPRERRAMWKSRDLPHGWWKKRESTSTNT